MRRLFVFRPAPGASQTIERARALGLDATSIPLFVVEPVDWSAPDSTAFDALLLTSANAVNSAGDQIQRLRGLPVYAVGEATAVAAEVAGMGVAVTGHGGVDQLLESIPEEVRLLHLCGEHRRSPETGRPIHRVTVYRARELPAASGLKELRGQVAAIHSPRAGRRLAELVREKDRGTIRIAAISEAAAEAVGPGWDEVRAAGSPDDISLLALAARLCES